MSLTASIFMNSSPYLGMASGKLGGTWRIIDVHGMIKYSTSSWGLQMKAPAVTTNLLKTQMMLNWEQKGPKVVTDDIGRMAQDDVIFRQNFCIRSYEVGPDGTASVETLMSHLQEANINHMKTIGLVHEGFGSEEMFKNDLTWVMVKLQMIMGRYPTWGDIVQVNTWKSEYGKNGGRCNFILCDCKTGEIIGRASSIWVMMNKKTRKLSKFPDDFRARIKQCLVDIPPPIVKQNTRTWSKRDENIEDHICKGLSARWSDLDVNQHVNNVKYIGWIFKSVPKTILENYEIESMTLQYYRECTMDSVVQSVTSILTNNNGEIANDDTVDCQHLLKFEIGGDILKGRTKWGPKKRKNQKVSKSEYGIHLPKHV